MTQMAISILDAGGMLSYHLNIFEHLDVVLIYFFKDPSIKIDYLLSLTRSQIRFSAPWYMNVRQFILSTTCNMKEPPLCTTIHIYR